MTLLEILGGAFVDVIGSLLAAFLLCYLGWNAFKLVHHPEIGVLFLLCLGWIGLRHHLTASTFVQMVVVYTGLGALILWPVGREWHRDHSS